MSDQVRCFVAYPSGPAWRAEAIEGAIESISGGGVVNVIGWKSLAISGRVVIGTICSEIRNRDLFIADLTSLNPNVLFELGYAIAHRKRVWLLLDPHIERSKLDFERFQLLTTIGYCPYSNSRDIVDGFYREQPYEHLDHILYNELVTTPATTTKRDALLYLKAQVNTEATVRLARRVDAGPLKSIIDDPKEVRIQPLSWYVQQVTSAFAVVTHLLSTEYENWELHNAKHALVGGLSHGLNKPLLMLAHDPYVSPIDYRDLLRVHRTAAQADAIFNDWLLPLVEQYEKRQAQVVQYQAEARAHGELRNIAIGDPIAEFESDEVPDYFVATAAYTEALHSKHSILVGRKGAGKTATLYKLTEDFGADPRNHVCIVKPVDYELEGLLDVLRQELSRAEKGYLVESFWKFLLYTELTKSVYEQLLSKPDYYRRTEDESRLSEFVEQHSSLITPEFSARLESAVVRLLDLQKGTDSEQQRLRISEYLHSEMIARLRTLLGRVLHTKAKVVVLVDNLDKAWTAGADLELLSEFLYGLLSVSGRVSVEFAKDAGKLNPVNLYFTLLLRSDIHSAMLRFARERDKLPIRRLTWEDPELLRRVVEERFVKSGAAVAFPAEIWERYFPPAIRGTTTREYLTQAILPRPRDMIYLVKAALQFAMNRGHTRIEENDVLSGEEQYSRFALDSLLVEATPRLPKIDVVLLDLVQGNDIVDERSFDERLRKLGLTEDQAAETIESLGELTFFGYEVSPGQFSYLYDQDDTAKVLAMARKTAEEFNGGVRRVRIHPAFHSYLELRNDKRSPGQMSITM